MSSISKNGNDWKDSVKNYGFVCCIKAFTITDDSLSNRFLLISNCLSTYYGNNAKLYATLNNIDGSIMSIKDKTINFTINGINYTRITNNQGEVSLAINLGSGEYVVSIFYEDSYNYVIENVDVIVKSTIESKNILKTYKNATQYSAVFYDNQGKLLKNADVKFNINGVFYTRSTNSNGIATLNINLASNTYIITAYNLVTNEVKSNQITVISSIKSNDIIKYYKNGTQYIATFYNSEGKLLKNADVKFNINGVFYTRSTNVSGIAKLNINLNPGSYIITAENPVTTELHSNLITVLSKLEANDTYIKYADGIDKRKFKVRVLDDLGNVSVNTDVTFNINGRFYTRTTDNNGIAMLTINLGPGSYIITTSGNQQTISNQIVVT